LYGVGPQWHALRLKGNGMLNRVRCWCRKPRGLHLWSGGAYISFPNLIKIATQAQGLSKNERLCFVRPAHNPFIFKR
jgi:hypothetical protein